MENDPILSAIARVLALHDSYVEYPQAGTMNTLIPEAVADALDLPEDVTFTTQAEDKNACFVNYGSEVLDKFEGLLDERGWLACLEVQFDGYLKTTGFEKLVSTQILPQNGLIHVLKVQPEKTPYLLCNIAYTATADEKRSGMVSFVVNALTGVAPISIGSALQWQADLTAAPLQPNIPLLPFESLSQIIEANCEHLVVKETEQWSKSLNRKQNRDEERLNAYYQGIIAEIRTKILRRHLTGEDEQRELARIAATQKELERKILDTQNRYALAIEAQLHSGLVIYLPTVHIQCELIRKKVRRPVTLIWNPYSRQIEPLRCEHSGQPVYKFYLSNDTAQILCENSWRVLQN
jgi:hypothetical protein